MKVHSPELCCGVGHMRHDMVEAQVQGGAHMKEMATKLPIEQVTLDSTHIDTINRREEHIAIASLTLVI